MSGTTPSDRDQINWLRFADAHDLPPLDFVLPGLLAGTVGMVVGPGGVGKSMLALAIGAGVALGAPVAVGHAGALFDAPKRGSVVIAFGEDPAPVIRLRQEAFRTGLAPAEVAELDAADGLAIASFHGCDMRVLDTTVRPFELGPWFSNLYTIAQGRRLAIVDPLAFLFGGDENDNSAMTRLMQMLSMVAHETGCAILVLHHTRKPGAVDKDDWSSARGASSITTAVRVQYNLRGPSDAEADELSIPVDRRWWWCRFATVKVNYCAPREPVWLSRSGPGGLLQRTDPAATPSERRARRKPARAGSDSYWEDAQ